METGDGHQKTVCVMMVGGPAPPDRDLNLNIVEVVWVDEAGRGMKVSGGCFEGQQEVIDG